LAITDYINLISSAATARDALKQLDSLPEHNARTLFVVDDANGLVGTITDGDIRRGLLAGNEISQAIAVFMRSNYKSIHEHELSPQKLREFKKSDIYLLPVINEQRVIQKIIDLKQLKTILPVSALLLAGGKGERLKPLTNNTPKPLLMVGNKPILEHNIDRLISYGVEEFFISVRYLKEQIMNFLGDGSTKKIKITYIQEDETPLGTIGCLSAIENFANTNLLVMNADVLTNIDFEDFYDEFIQANAMLSIASIPYSIQIPYGVLQTNENGAVVALAEKPTYTYYSNGGIYFMHNSVTKYVPKQQKFDATELIETLIAANEKVHHFQVLNYWLDIGKQDDFLKAQKDIKYLEM